MKGGSDYMVHFAAESYQDEMWEKTDAKLNELIH